MWSYYLNNYLKFFFIYYNNILSLILLLLLIFSLFYFYLDNLLYNYYFYLKNLLFNYYSTLSYIYIYYNIFLPNFIFNIEYYLLYFYLYYFIVFNIIPHFYVLKYIFNLYSFINKIPLSLIFEFPTYIFINSSKVSNINLNINTLNFYWLFLHNNMYNEFLYK